MLASHIRSIFRYDGAQLWHLQGLPGMHTMVWLTNMLSFLFLCPSTFNLLEVGRTAVFTHIHDGDELSSPLSPTILMTGGRGA
jgi:uncharacterized membrane protein